MLTRDPTFNFEVVKLLMQAAWADLELQPEEAELIMRRAGLALLPQDVATVRACLQGSQKLPAPDFSMLRLHREEVLRLVRELFLSDAAMGQDETDVLGEIETLLG